MKKVIAIFLLSIILGMALVLDTKNIYAESYKYFQSMNFDGEKVDLIDTWSTDKLNSYKRYVSSPKFMGWDIHYLYRRQHFTFISDTLYKITNTGSSEIVQTYKYVQSETRAIEKSSKGTISLSGSVGGGKEKYKLGLDSKLEIKNEESIKISETETDQIKIVVAPYSYLTVTKEGEGYFYQGIAQNHFFWVKTQYGAFEYVIVTTEHYAIHLKGIRSTR